VFFDFMINHNWFEWSFLCVAGQDSVTLGEPGSYPATVLLTNNLYLSY